MPQMVAGGLAAVAGCLALAFPAPAAADSRRDPGHAAYYVTLSWHAHDRRLDGTERVSFENTRGRAIRSVWVRLWANGVASCDHPRISAKVLAGGHAAAFPSNPSVESASVYNTAEGPVAPSPVE